MKRKLILLSAVVICIAIAAAGTLAYFTADTTAHNVITSGGVDIGIREWADEVGGTPYDDAAIGNVMPATKVTKIADIINQPDKDVSSAQAWIRAKVDVEITLNKYTIAALKDKDPNFVEPTPDTTLVKRKGTDANWVYNETDGYYYYQLAVDPGDATEPLFTEVEFDARMDNAYQNCSVKIYITAEAVQTAHNPDPVDKDGNPVEVTVDKALGWPGSDPAPAPEEGEGEGDESLPLEGEGSVSQSETDGVSQGETLGTHEVVDEVSGADAAAEEEPTTTPQSADADSSPDKGSQDPIDPENP